MAQQNNQMVEKFDELKKLDNNQLEKQLETALTIGKKVWVVTARILGIMFEHVPKDKKKAKQEDIERRFGIKYAMQQRYLQAYKSFKDGNPIIETTDINGYIEATKTPKNTIKPDKMFALSIDKVGTYNIVDVVEGTKKRVSYLVKFMKDRKTFKPNEQDIKSYNIPSIKYDGRPAYEIGNGISMLVCFKLVEPR